MFHESFVPIKGTAMLTVQLKHLSVSDSVVLKSH